MVYDVLSRHDFVLFSIALKKATLVKFNFFSPGCWGGDGGDQEADATFRIRQTMLPVLLGNLKRPHPTSGTKTALNWELRMF